MAEPSLLAPPPFAFPDLPDSDFAAADFDLDFDFDLADLDLFDVDPPPPPPPPTSSSSSSGAAAGSRSPDSGSSFAATGGSANPKSEEELSPSPDARSTKSKRGREDEEAKRVARLARNRESAHMSRQRKKLYVEELEEKVKAMHATIADLTAKISHVTAENATLRQQVGAGGGVPLQTPVPPPLYPAFYPSPLIHPAFSAMGRSHVPLVPIPRLKPQQPAAAVAEPPARKARKVESKTKKVASVSLLGLLCLLMVCGGLIPAVVNRMHGEVDGRENVPGSVLGLSHHGRVLAVKGRQDHGLNGVDSKLPLNESETLPALLYLPRKGKHVKINGNLVIKSVLASERAFAHMSSNDGKNSGNQGNKETSLAIPGYVAPLEVQRPRESKKGCKDQLALAPGDGSMYREDDGLLPQWFSEAMAGPMLSSGMCTEVFQFNISPSSAHVNGIVPVYSTATSNSSQNSTGRHPRSRADVMKNRRILYSEAIPLPGATSNDTEHLKSHPKNDSYGNNKPLSSVVVSVLADPREAGDADGEGRMSSKSLSRIFVVVLIDSVKYVTYSCVLPFKNHSPHL